MAGRGYRLCFRLCSSPRTHQTETTEESSSGSPGTEFTSQDQISPEHGEAEQSPPSPKSFRFSTPLNFTLTVHGSGQSHVQTATKLPSIGKLLLVGSQKIKFSGYRREHPMSTPASLLPPGMLWVSTIFSKTVIQGHCADPTKALMLRTVTCVSAQ